MQTHFYISHGGEEIGPFEVEEIKAKLETNEIYDFDYAYVEAQEDWILLSEFLKRNQTNEDRYSQKTKDEIRNLGRDF